VRVEACTSELINSLYPGESTAELSPRLRALLEGSGHIGRRFSPSARRAAIPAARAAMPRWDGNSREPFVQYTLAALELRRLLAQARHANESFSLTYVRLPGAVGDEAWRANATGPRIHITEDGRGGRRCVFTPASGARPLSLFGNTPCEPQELPLLPPPTVSPLIRFLPHPILPGIGELPCIQ